MESKINYNFRNSLILYKNGYKFDILDIQNKSIYSKTLSMAYSDDITWAYNNSFFILNSNKSVYLYNFFNMSFKSWIDFQGDINVTKINNYLLECSYFRKQ